MTFLRIQHTQREDWQQSMAVRISAGFLPQTKHMQPGMFGAFKCSARVNASVNVYLSAVCLTGALPWTDPASRPVGAGCGSRTRKYDSGEYLNITGITRDQAGDYECSALNDIASPDSKTVKVTVNFAPSIHEIKSNGVGLGRTALIRCEAAAVPSPTFEWYKGEKRIIKGQGIDIKSLSSRSVLTVTNMTEDRYGNYTCVATNKLGTANASMAVIRK
ncbi:neuronal growth regulator 1-like [Lampetra planeri]